MELTDKRYLDPEGGLARVRGNQALYARMLGMFQKSGEFDTFEEVLVTGDLSRAAEVMHGIKGLTGNLEMPLLFSLSTELVEELRAGTRDDGKIGQYRQALTETRRLVEAYLGGQ